MTNNIARKIHTIDATDKAVGRLASQIALILRGKNKPEYVPNNDCGDRVNVTNITKVKFTGKKLEQKKYYNYSGYPSGLKERKLSDVFAAKPKEVLIRAVRKMLPAVKFRQEMLKRLSIK